MNRPHRTIAFVMIALGLPIATAVWLPSSGIADLWLSEAAAQNPPRHPRGTAAPAPRRPAKPPDAGGSGAASTEAPSDAAVGVAPAQGIMGNAPVSSERLGDGGVVEVRKYGDGGQAMRFSELDIEGRLRSPQLVYFLRRVRAEFAAGDLGHRTFMRELSETRKDPSF